MWKTIVKWGLTMKKSTLYLIIAIIAFLGGAILSFVAISCLEYSGYVFLVCLLPVMCGYVGGLMTYYYLKEREMELAVEKWKVFRDTILKEIEERENEPFKEFEK